VNPLLYVHDWRCFVLKKTAFRWQHLLHGFFVSHQWHCLQWMEMFSIWNHSSHLMAMIRYFLHCHVTCVILLFWPLLCFTIDEGDAQGRHGWVSYDQLRAALLIGRNTVTWHWALSYVYRFTVTRGDIIMSPQVMSRDVPKCKRKIYSTLFLFTFSLFFWHLAESFCKIQFKSINQCDFAVKISTVINTYS